MSCRRGPGIRRRWAEFPLVRLRDGKAEIPDKRNPEAEYTLGSFNPESHLDWKAA